MVSLFDPSRFDLTEYKGWDLTRLGGNHREFSIDLNRNGISRATCQLYFNGATSFFKELPKTPSEEVYRDISMWEAIKI